MNIRNGDGMTRIEFVYTVETILIYQEITGNCN